MLILTLFAMLLGGIMKNIILPKLIDTDVDNLELIVLEDIQAFDLVFQYWVSLTHRNLMPRKNSDRQAIQKMQIALQI